MISTRRLQPLPPLRSGVGREPAEDRAVPRSLDAELGKHPDRVELAGRLDQAGKDELAEHLVTIGRRLEAEPLVDPAQRLPQMLGLRRGDRQRLPCRAAVAEVKGVLVRVQPLPGCRLQHLHLGQGVGGADVLDIARPAPTRVHDLDRGRTAGSLHRPDVSHPDRLNHPRISAQVATQHP